MRLRKLERLLIYSFVSTREYYERIRRLNKEERRITYKSDLATVNRYVSLSIPFKEEFSGARSITKLAEYLEHVNGVTFIAKVPDD